jgi:RNA-directed DNA polymerase
VIPPHLYIREGLRRSVAVDHLERAASEHRRLAARGAYPLITLGQLAHESGATYNYLREVAARLRDPYTSISIPKPSGGLRPISSPEPILMDVQRWILSNVLISVQLHPASFAYRRGVSIVDCATRHAGANWMLKLDLHDFFGSVNESAVYRVFRGLGYRKLLAFELARLSTRAEGAIFSPERHRVISTYSVDQQGVLPQGAPTSGVLANAVAGHLDARLQHFADEHSMVYTRYSDDLIFSTYKAFDRARAERALGQLAGIVRSSGFTVHRKKSRIIPPGSRRIVLGLLVDDSVRLLPDARRRIEVHLRGCEKFGIANHARHRKFDSVFSFVDHLGGWISFAMGVERERATAWRAQFLLLLERDGFPPAIP